MTLESGRKKICGEFQLIFKTTKYIILFICIDHTTDQCLVWGGSGETDTEYFR